MLCSREMRACVLLMGASSDPLVRGMCVPECRANWSVLRMTRNIHAPLQQNEGRALCLQVYIYVLSCFPSLWGASFQACRPACAACSSVGKTFWTRSCWLTNRALARDILKKSRCFLIEHRSKQYKVSPLKLSCKGGSNLGREMQCTGLALAHEHVRSRAKGSGS